MHDVNVFAICSAVITIEIISHKAANELLLSVTSVILYVCVCVLCCDIVIAVCDIQTHARVWYVCACV